MSTLSTPDDRHLCNPSTLVDRRPGSEPPVDRPTPAAEAGVLVVAHGSRDPRAATVAHDVAAALPAEANGARSDEHGRGEDGRGEDVAAAAFLELASPDPATALDALVSHGVRDVTVVPFLLGRAYHAKTDLPGVLEAARSRCLGVHTADVLGPHPLLASLLLRRIREASTNTEDAAGSEFDTVVLAAAGSSDPEGNAGVAELAETLSASLRVPVAPAYASAASPDPATAVRQAGRHGRVLVASYLLAPGFFADRVAEASRNAGAVAVTQPLGAAPEVVRVVAERVSAARP